MIFFTCGNMPNFQRVIEHIDLLIPELDEDVFMQIGETEYTPINARYEPFLKDQQKYFEQARLIISHGGFSTLEIIYLGKPLIIVPRQLKYGEHFNDHQGSFAEFLNRRFNVPVFLDVSELSSAFIRDYNRGVEFDRSPITRFQSHIEKVVFGETDSGDAGEADG